MNIFKIIASLYTNKNTVWIQELDESLINAYIIQRFLAMNDKIRVQTRWLDKYVFVLPPKMYLSLAWSTISKVQKAPFIKYIKQQDDVEEFDFILQKIRHQYKISDNDFRAMKDRIIAGIKKDMVIWFSYYGIKKAHWKKYYLDFKQIAAYGEEKKEEPQLGLAAWGLK